MIFASGIYFVLSQLLEVKNRLFCSLRFIKQILLRESREIELKLENHRSKICQKGLGLCPFGLYDPIWALPGNSKSMWGRFKGSESSVNHFTSDHTIVHNVYVDYDNQSTHSKLHRPSFICNDVINDVIKRREIRRPPVAERKKELSPQVLKHRQRWLARINRIHRPFLTDRKPLR